MKRKMRKIIWIFTLIIPILLINSILVLGFINTQGQTSYFTYTVYGYARYLDNSTITGRAITVTVTDNDGMTGTIVKNSSLNGFYVVTNPADAGGTSYGDNMKIIAYDAESNQSYSIEFNASSASDNRDLYFNISKPVNTTNESQGGNTGNTGTNSGSFGNNPETVTTASSNGNSKTSVNFDSGNAEKAVELSLNKPTSISINNEAHSLGVTKIDLKNKKAFFKLMSKVIEFELNEGEMKNFSIDNDSIDDISVKLEKIISQTKVNLSLKKIIHAESQPSSGIPNNAENADIVNNTEEKKEESGYNNMNLAIIGIAVLAIIIVIVIAIIKMRKKKTEWQV